MPVPIWLLFPELFPVLLPELLLELLFELLPDDALPELELFDPELFFAPACEIFTLRVGEEKVKL